MRERKRLSLAIHGRDVHSFRGRNFDLPATTRGRANNDFGVVGTFVRQHLILAPLRRETGCPGPKLVCELLQATEKCISTRY
ncbi:hypothetical protein AWB80_04178 [Caballeronia pedi]|uniref:Uncharacterized protein n=1 Tax=Caballeronia pedi TaxID=1777141 RepID=A0A158BUT2_9BURK|nr:hypothetical protein AWB80_04178 [Caballeronia pedi]